MGGGLGFWAAIFGIVFVLSVLELMWKNGVAFVELFDMLIHHKEYKTKGGITERFAYNWLKKLGVSKEQIFRNVYIPVKDSDKTTEIDLLVLSKKGILVFECKNYSGVIYGDGKRKQWVQYLGRKKYYFRSPVEQNEYHARCLREFVGDGVNVYMFIVHSRGGRWKVKNIPEEAHFLDKEGQFMRIYNSLPNNDVMSGKYVKLKEDFAKLSRPTDGTREKHIEEFGK